MKPFLILVRIVFVGIFWSIFFLEGIRVIMLSNWRFDILRLDHWNHAWNLWLSGWIIDDAKEWAFVLIILTFIPLWLTGWAALSTIKWGKMISNAVLLPLKIFKKVFESPVSALANAASVKVVKKKKSYKEVRPRSIREPMDENAYKDNSSNKKASVKKPQPTQKAPKIETKAPVFDHSLFQFDEDDADLDFNIDSFDEKISQPQEEPEAPKEVKQQAPQKSKNKNKNKNNNAAANNKPAPAQKQAQAPATQQKNSGNSTHDALKQKGFEVITGATIKNTLIDFIGVSEGQICICMNDKEPGDWLADEERFNDEEPLWFSESSHRISPVRKLDIARLILTEKLKEADLSFDVEAYLVIQIGNIINAEDMFDTWNELDINVTRIDRGTPKELKLFNKAIPDASQISKDKFEEIKKLIRSIA